MWSRNLTFQQRLLQMENIRRCDGAWPSGTPQGGDGGNRREKAKLSAETADSATEPGLSANPREGRWRLQPALGKTGLTAGPRGAMKAAADARKPAAAREPGNLPTRGSPLKQQNRQSLAFWHVPSRGTMEASTDATEPGPSARPRGTREAAATARKPGMTNYAAMHSTRPGHSARHRGDEGGFCRRDGSWPFGTSPRGNPA